MIELAPNNAYGLALQSPVLVAPGCAAALRSIDPTLVGAVLTRTATRHSTVGQRRWSRVPAGVIFERLPSTRLRSLLQHEARRWNHIPVPVLLAVRGPEDELADMVNQLELLDALAGIVVEVDPTAGARSVAAVRDNTALPVLAQLPHGAFDLAAACVAAGADALVVQAYAPGVGLADGVAFEGVLVGPAQIAWTLRALQLVRAAVDVPLVATGGIADATLARQCLALGASAVMVDGALYGDPDAPSRIGAELAAG
jgi:dihydroorotate dehydrogenase